MKRPVFCLRKTLYPKPLNFLFSKNNFIIYPQWEQSDYKKVWEKMRGFRRRRRLWRDKAGGGVPPAFLFAVALAHPVVYSHFRILQGKKRKLYKKVWKKMRGCRGRRKEPYKKAGGTPKGFFFSPCNKSVIFYNTAM